MKKYLYLIILLCFCLGCQNSLNTFKKEGITHIDVYYIPFDILSPIETTQEYIKLDIHKKVIKGNDIEQICNELLLLKEIKGIDYMDTGIYLRADFYNKDKEVLRLLFDKVHFKIDNTTYKENTDLVNLLIK
ncbi:MAG: hypothetical protein HRT66_05045 [Flavobacteriaceae bacterium]|nr:hypothetical protein [Flavobacteriaceae bacterium]